MHTAIMTRVADNHKSQADKFRSIARKLAAESNKQACEDKKKGVKAMAKRIKTSNGSTINFLKTEAEEGRPPRYITDPEEMDAMLRAKWGKIYDGNQDDNDKLTSEFCAKYRGHIYEHEEVTIPPISAQDVHEVFTNSKKSAAGLDSWEPAEFKLFS